MKPPILRHIGLLVGVSRPFLLCPKESDWRHWVEDIMVGWNFSACDVVNE